MNGETSDRGFSAEQLRTLASVLDEIVPPSEDGRLPGAGEVGVAAYVDQVLRSTPELHAMVAQGLAELDDLARGRNVADFSALSRQDKLQLLNEWGFVLPLTIHAYSGYYQSPRVVEALGLEARPPHPKGYEMEPNDLSLLDPVRRSGKRYRSVGGTK